MNFYLLTKFQVCSVTLTSFRQRGSQNNPLKSPPRLGLIKSIKSTGVKLLYCKPKTQVTQL